MQYDMFDQQIPVPGLNYIAGYITAVQEKELISLIDNMPWL
jgi:hypothetical protein